MLRFNLLRHPHRRLVLLALCLTAGCAGYRSGSRSLYAPDVATIFVPMVESDSFRRDLGERLTEALVKEIELKTPYKVINSPNADSVLEVRLRSDRRSVQAEDQFDNPRVFTGELRAEVTWLNRRRLPLGPVQVLPLPEGFTGTALPTSAIGVGQSTPLIPESGQTVASQQQLAIARLAEQIVGVMEEPW
ncbi:hypothetical protein Pla108_41140 [Botrimarina colliarenosi]|uniref:Lipopolysaccharide-assembly n=1 Tax=Botrimarina colliarenosi TaxID=2528001 RepID=A0A5C5ZZ00_9BACT|nr:LPS assembly lipoprotein LptE [Botrimarina colliarenosi]TWT92315.1 hypothetical protein Pla108_41140 [Botrimarina colliarenosi]